VTKGGGFGRIWKSCFDGWIASEGGLFEEKCWVLLAEMWIKELLEDKKKKKRG
jgi:hypothetical protein